MPSGAVTVNQAVNAAPPIDAPGTLLAWLKRYPLLPWAFLAIAIALAVVLFFVLGPLAGGLAAAAIIATGIYIFRLTAKVGPGAASHPNPSRPDARKRLELSLQQQLCPQHARFTFVPSLSGPDSATGVRFNTALAESFALNASANTTAQHPAPVAIDVTAVSETMLGCGRSQVHHLASGTQHDLFARLDHRPARHGLQ